MNASHQTVFFAFPAEGAVCEMPAAAAAGLSGYGIFVDSRPGRAMVALPGPPLFFGPCSQNRVSPTPHPTSCLHARNH